jgi:PKD repeat protein
MFRVMTLVDVTGIAKSPNDNMSCWQNHPFVNNMSLKSYATYAGLIFLLLALMTPAVFADNTAEVIGYITTGEPPIANFNALYAYNTVPAMVSFQDYSTGTTPLTYLWEFGDGAQSTEQNPQHNYIRKGIYTVKLTVTNFYGSSVETKLNYISIGLAPNAGFTGEPLSGNAPLTVVFTDHSSGYPTSWAWNFGDGQTSTVQNPVHTYWTSGEYTVTQTATNEYGSSTAGRDYYVHVMPALAAKFSADPSAGLAPLLVKFTDMSTGSPETWTWNFGDGSTSTGSPNPVHNFVTAGAFHVKLTVTRGLVEDSLTKTIVVGGVPAVDFYADSTTVKENTPIVFTDKTLNSPTSWKWNFGDGGTSTEQNPTRIYRTKGIYTVSLTATNKNGMDTETKVNYITVGVPPTADFSTKIPAYQIGGRAQYVKFVDESIGNPLTWSWDFGDGSTYEGQFPPLHLYNVDGSYTVSLTVKNPFGQDTRTKSNLITVKEGPRIDFKADRTTLSTNQYVHFTDLSTMSPTSWSWDFGDGSTSMDQNPDHAYREVGVYTVRLTASDGYTSNTLTKKDYITVVNLPNANFVADKTRGVAPFAVHFSDLSTGNPTAWQWDFGDGAVSNEQNPTHEYTTTGTTITSKYTVTLTALNINGQGKETKVDYITVTHTPIADFTVGDRRGKVPFVVNFQDISMGKPSTWAWDFGDGGMSNEQNPTHVYPFEGAYDVRLTVTNQYGSDTVFKTGTTSQRNNATPIIMPVFVDVTGPIVLAPTMQGGAPAASATTQAGAVKTTAAPTQSPLPALVPVAAASLGLLAIALNKRK